MIFHWFVRHPICLPMAYGKQMVSASPGIGVDALAALEPERKRNRVGEVARVGRG
jgi:hypothetical protein